MNSIFVDNAIGGRAHSGAPLPLHTFAGFVTAVAAVILIAFFSHQSLKDREETANLIVHTFNVTQNMESLLSMLKDAETGQRGFLLTGVQQYLEPYTNAKAALPGQFQVVRQLIADNPVQQRRLASLEIFAGEKMAEVAETIALRRSGKLDAAFEMMRSDRGRDVMDRARALIAEMKADETALLERRQQGWREAVDFSFYTTMGGAAILLVLIMLAAVLASRDYRARQMQIWLREGQMGLAGRLQGEQRMEKLGDSVLAFLADFVGAQVGAVYVEQPGGDFMRVAGYAIPGGLEHDKLRSGAGLLGEAAKENRVIHVRDLPEDYIPISSSLGSGKPRELLLVPAGTDGVVQAVIELGFFHALRREHRELLERVSESFGIAVRSSKDRTQLEELLEETQTQAEELQAQQEELRVNNEELEEQGRALKETQGRMETQQAELEQTNSQLEEQAQLLEGRKDELTRSQAVLSLKTAELERSNQYKSEFLANMSHELRTPLNSSLILAKLLADNRDGNLSAEQVKFAKTISSAGNDLLALINDILDLSKIESGKVDVVPEQVAIAATVDFLEKTFQPVAQQKQLTFAITLDPGVPGHIETDQQRLGQILKNLLSNAFKFTDKGGVALRLSSAPDGTLSFSVSDTGIGIPPDQQRFIFEAFRQADGSTHRKYGGTGLGLSISRDLALLLGGNLVVQSEAGRGSVFTLTLPTSFVKPAQMPSGQPLAATPSQTRAPVAVRHAPLKMFVDDDRERLAADARMILVVEDDVRFAAILKDLVHEMGFQCVVTNSANDAMTAARLYRPKAVLLDINLPDHSGLSVLDQLKRDPQLRHVPVHVASVTDFTREALELGAIGYSLKPVKREQLVEALRRLETKFSQSLRRLLVVEDDARQRESIRQLLANPNLEITGVENAADALSRLRATTFDCMVMDLNLPDLSGYELLERMSGESDVSFPPVIVYTGRSLSRDEEQKLRRFSKSIIIKDARSPERLLDEVSLFLHQVEAELPLEHQRMLKVARDREAALEGRRILVVEDDVRNIFALSSVLEPKGVKVEIARNGREALESIGRSGARPEDAIDLVLMDVMMPEMDGITAMREIRKNPKWQKLPIIALTAKAMKDDQEKCLAAGANDYIAKPLDVEKLLSLVRVWMPK